MFDFSHYAHVGPCLNNTLVNGLLEDKGISIYKRLSLDFRWIKKDGFSVANMIINQLDYL